MEFIPSYSQSLRWGITQFISYLEWYCIGWNQNVIWFYRTLQKSCIREYNKRSMIKPLFLVNTYEDQTIISDPGDHSLILTGRLFCSPSVITNSNYPNFRSAGIAVGLDSCFIYVANSMPDCIHRYDKYSSLGCWYYRNGCSLQFGNTGTEHGQFQCPQGLAVSEFGLLYICDQDNHCIQVYNAANNQESFYHACSREEGHP